MKIGQIHDRAGAVVGYDLYTRSFAQVRDFYHPGNPASPIGITHEHIRRAGANKRGRAVDTARDRLCADNRDVQIPAQFHIPLNVIVGHGFFVP